LESEKKEREKLQELDKLKTRFFTNVSHELKTPLTLILGPLANTLEKINNEEAKQDVLLAYNNAERLHDLINETLDFSKLESGKLEIVKSPVLISETLKRSFLSFQSLAEMKNIMLRFQSTIGDETYISCDYGKLEKIVNNLVSNAIKFSENNSLVILSANIDDNLTVEVVDHGRGVPVEEQDKIFNRFYQAKHNQYGNYGGTGVGLAFSKELAEVMNGTLSIKSKPEEGSTFILTIPAQIVSAPIVQAAETRDDKNIGHLAYESLLIDGEKPKLLIVEDNPEMQQYLISILGDQYQCFLANDGYEAIKMVQTNTFHLISSDIMMPNMDGFSLKAKINQISGNRSIPFIFLSARSQDEDVLEGLQLGVDDYITKPFNKYEYLARIHNLLTNRKERIDSLVSFGSNENTESVDVKILKEVEKDILVNLNNTDYKVSNLADTMHYSQRQLGRIVKQLTGMSPIELILELRLQKAHRLLKKKHYSSIAEVRYEVGIESPSYFARKFKERFGVSPSEI
jgi:DNA-binding response OmpR family regulator